VRTKILFYYEIFQLKVTVGDSHWVITDSQFSKIQHSPTFLVSHFLNHYYNTTIDYCYFGSIYFQIFWQLGKYSICKIFPTNMMTSIKNSFEVRPNAQVTRKSLKFGWFDVGIFNFGWFYWIYFGCLGFLNVIKSHHRLALYCTLWPFFGN
jgi:hypothetical protein